MLPSITHVFRLTRDPEVRYMQDGTAITSVGLAASEKRKDKERTLFLDGTAFGKTAEFLLNVRKGQRVFVRGRLSTDAWTNNDGAKRSKTVLTIDAFEYIEARDGATPAPAPAPEPQSQAVPPKVPEIDVDDGEIPF
jgi:single-strand DNA-binding protein